MNLTTNLIFFWIILHTMWNNINKQQYNAEQFVMIYGSSKLFIILLSIVYNSEQYETNITEY